MPYLIFLKNRQNFKLSSAASYRWRFQGSHHLTHFCFSMGLVEHIHPGLAEIDYSGSSTRLSLIGLSYLFYSAVFLVSLSVSSLIRTYRNLTGKEKVFWHLAIVRGCYGFFCIAVGTWAIFYDQELQKDVVFSTSPTSYFALTVTIGFFIFECSMLLVMDIYYKQFNILLNIHHWLALVGYSLIMIFNSTHYFGTNGLILEMSTPFSCLCWTLLKAGKAHTLLWKANQFFLVHTFHLRSVVECYLWYRTYQHWDYIWTAMPGTMFVILYTQLVLVTCVMTPYWTYKKTVQMINPIDWNFEDSEKTKQMNGSAKKSN